MNSAQRGKKRGLKSCLRCHRRKQRCIGYPICGACQATSSECVREPDYVPRKLAGLSKEKLLDRIEQLESGRNPGEPDIGCEADEALHLHVRGNSTVSTEVTDYHVDAEFVGKGFGSDRANAEECQATSEAPSAEATSVPLLFGSGSTEQPLLWPTSEAGQHMIRAYLGSFHKRVPFFDHTDLMDLHAAYFDKAQRPILSQYQLYKLLMVYAIGSTVLSMKSTDQSHRPQELFRMARTMSATADFSTIDQIESIMFTVVYRLRESLDSRVWFEIGLALRTAIAAGLHREQYYQALDPVTADWRRRLFWCIYVMERNVCFSMKRPVSLADYDIDVGSPSVKAHPSSEQHPSSGARESAVIIDLDTSTAILALVKIKSQMHVAIHRVDRIGAIGAQQVKQLLDQIRAFERSVIGYNDQDFLQLHINNAIRNLIEPILTTLDKEDELLRVCLQASGRTCQLFRKLQQTQSMGFGFTMANSVFIAGLTICYILFKNSNLWKPSTSNDLRAGSAILSIMAERNPNMRKYCDVLEATINGVTAYADAYLGMSDPFNSNTDQSDISASLPPAFEKLGDTFRELGFELPPEAYPEYTTSPEASTASRAGFPNSRAVAQSTWGNPQDIPQISADFTFSEYDQTDQAWSLAHTVNDLGIYEELPFVYNEYAQQMMTEMLGPHIHSHNPG